MSVETLILAPIVGMLVWFVQDRIQAFRDERRRLQDVRRGIYLKALEPVIRALAGGKNPKQRAAAVKQISSFEHRRTMYELNFIGSDEVIRANNALMQSVFSFGDGENDTINILNQWADLVLAIRRDLGSKRTKLEPVDMLAGQITDIEKLLPLK